jgi:hypothetical protein
MKMQSLGIIIIFAGLSSSRLIEAADGQHGLRRRVITVAITTYVFRGEPVVSKIMYDICKEECQRLERENNQLREGNTQLRAENRRLKKRMRDNVNRCPTLDSCALL